MINILDKVPGAPRFEPAHLAAHPAHENQHNRSVARHTPVNPISPMVLGLWPSSSEKIPCRSVVSLVTVARRPQAPKHDRNLPPDILDVSTPIAVRVGYIHGAAVTPLINSGIINADRRDLAACPGRIKG